MFVPDNAIATLSLPVLDTVVSANTGNAMMNIPVSSVKVCFGFKIFSSFLKYFRCVIQNLFYGFFFNHVTGQSTRISTMEPFPFTSTPYTDSSTVMAVFHQ